jgi:hypothetical protein
MVEIVLVNDDVIAKKSQRGVMASCVIQVQVVELEKKRRKAK